MQLFFFFWNFRLARLHGSDVGSRKQDPLPTVAFCLVEGCSKNHCRVNFRALLGIRPLRTAIHLCWYSGAKFGPFVFVWNSRITVVEFAFNPQVDLAIFPRGRHIVGGSICVRTQSTGDLSSSPQCHVTAPRAP